MCELLVFIGDRVAEAEHELRGMVLRNDIVAIREDGARYHPREGPPLFQVVKIPEVSQAEMSIFLSAEMKRGERTRLRLEGEDPETALQAAGYDLADIEWKLQRVDRRGRMRINVWRLERESSRSHNLDLDNLSQEQLDELEKTGACTIVPDELDSVLTHKKTGMRGRKGDREPTVRTISRTRNHDRRR